jgi:hypothetical protein
VVKRAAAKKQNVIRIKNAVAQMVPVAKKLNVQKRKRQNVIRIKNAVAQMVPAVSRNRPFLRF